MTLQRITAHTLEALDRLPEQYRDKPRIASLVELIGDRHQQLENSFFSILNSEGLAGGEAAELDQLGDIVGQKRGGRSDAAYRLRILAKIGQNVSKGTAEDLISIFKLLMQAERVYYNPLFPAAASLTAIGTNPVGTIEEVRAAMEQSAAAGVSFDYFVITESTAFSFLEDPDPNGRGFGDVNNPGLGGYAATLL
jgi:hypothetical protein